MRPQTGFGGMNRPQPMMRPQTSFGGMNRPQPTMQPQSSARPLRPIINNSRPTTGGGGNQYGISTGMRVLHQKFGEGIVEKTEGSGDNMKAYIKFANAGVKQLLLKFAKLEIL